MASFVAFMEPERSRTTDFVQVCVQRFFLCFCPLLLESSETLADRTPLNGFFHKSFSTSCHSSPLMTRRVNLTSARMVTHSIAIPMLKPKNTSIICNICFDNERFVAHGTMKPTPQISTRLPRFLLTRS